MTAKERPPGGDSRGSEVTLSAPTTTMLPRRAGPVAYAPDLELVEAVRRVLASFPGSVIIRLRRP
jgi:hypothetical protein